jgi:putative NIF3 family GTP cyclohydrolase 1 type 2
MNIKDIYREVVKKGIEADPRGKKEIEKLLKEEQKAYQKLEKRQKDLFDCDRFFNPFSDTRILNGNEAKKINSLMVGVDISGEEILLVDKLKERGLKIDLLVSHHPMGRAYANFYEVMELQVDVFVKKGVSLSSAESLLKERKNQVLRRVSSANHDKPVDIARWLNINLMCMHTPADNLACDYIEKLMKKEKPRHLEDIVDLLLDVPEYKEAAKINNPPRIFSGSKKARVSNIHIEFTGGTEGPKEIYGKLAAAGIDTIIAMHQSEEHVKKCKDAHINVVVASHIASDNLGINLMLDHLLSKSKLTVYECSGFKRSSHKKHR